jgi:hypothetical protein
MTVLCISTLVFKNLSKIQIIDIFLSILSKINKYLILTSKQKMFYLYAVDKNQKQTNTDLNPLC